MLIHNNQERLVTLTLEALNLFGKKASQPKGFAHLEIIINILVSSFRFI